MYSYPCFICTPSPATCADTGLLFFLLSNETEPQNFFCSSTEFIFGFLFLLVGLRVQTACFERCLNNLSFSDVHGHHLGPGIMLPCVDDPPCCRYSNDAEEDDDVVVHRLRSRGNAEGCSFKEALVSQTC